MTTGFVGCDRQSVRKEHGRMFRRLDAYLGVHRHALNAEGWRVLTRAAFALYLDSPDWQLPLFSEDQFPNDLAQPHLDAPEARAGPPVPDVHQRAA